MPEVFGPYRLESLLGRGGMGEVWRAVDLRRGRVVALKRLLAHISTDPVTQARFRREAQLTARLQSPHVIPIHDYGEINGRLFVDMRFVQGRDLHKVLGHEGRLPPERAVGIVGQVADALDEAHRSGMVHRDIKPSNVVLAGGRRDFAYLVDFGIAAALSGDGSTRLTSAGSFVGTMAYMAPERFERSGEAPADVYALACLLFELLTGRAPFEGGPLQMMSAILNGPPPSLRRARPDLPPGIEAVLNHGLARDPRHRFPTAGALADAAVAALRRPPPPRPPPAAAQLSLVLRYAARSEAPEEGVNQDAVYAGPRLVALADGDRAGGEVAARLVVAALSSLDADEPGDDILGELREGVLEGNRAVAGHLADHPDRHGMRTTVTALLFDGPRLGLLHVGNSRAYRLRDGELSRLTRDDSYVQPMLDEGRITEAEARGHPLRTLLLRAVTGGLLDPSLSTHDALAGDRYLLVSDGVTDVLDDDSVADVLRTSGAPHPTAHRLVDSALRAGAADDVTCVVADVVTVELGAPAPVVGGAVG